MRKIILIISCLFAVTALAKSEVQQEVTEYTEAKTAIVVTADKPEFVIKLKSNPTTGYSWFLRDYDNQLLQTEHHQFIAPPDKKIMGQPGFEVWTFKVKRAGFVVPHQTLIRLVYARPWDSENSSTQEIFSVSTLDDNA